MTPLVVRTNRVPLKDDYLVRLYLFESKLRNNASNDELRHCALTGDYGGGEVNYLGLLCTILDRCGEYILSKMHSPYQRRVNVV